MKMIWFQNWLSRAWNTGLKTECKDWCTGILCTSIHPYYIVINIFNNLNHAYSWIHWGHKAISKLYYTLPNINPYRCLKLCSLYTFQMPTIIECLLFGFTGNSSYPRLINFCTFYAKYFIDTHKIKDNNSFECLGYLLSGLPKTCSDHWRKNLHHKTPRNIICPP